MKPVQNTPSFLNVDVGKSFLNKHPQAVRALQITAVILGVLAVLVASAAFVAFPAGLPIVMGVVGVFLGVGSALLFSSVRALVDSIKEHSQKKNQDQLYLSSMHTAISENKEKLGSRASYDAMVERLQALDITLSSHTREVFKNAGKDGEEILQGIERISKNYRASIDLLKERQEAHQEEIIVESKDNIESYKVKNAFLVNIGMSIANALPRAGGALSLKFKDLSKGMERIHKWVTVGLAIGGIACIAIIAALLPGGILALPLLVSATLGIGLAVMGLSYGLREILKRTKTNKQQLYRELIGIIDIRLLKDMTKYQDTLLQLLAKTLHSEIKVAKLSQPIYKKYTSIEEQLRYLQEQLQEMEFKLRFMHRGYDRRAAMLEKGLSQLSDNERVPRVREQEDRSEGFDDLITQGKRAAQERRRRDREESLVIGDYSMLSVEEQSFGDSWHPRGSRQLENFWSAHVDLEREDQILLTEGIAVELVTLKKEIHAIKQEIQKTLEQLRRAKEIKLQAGQGSEALIAIWYNVQSSTYACLTVLKNLQFTLQKLMESEGNSE